jgi:hypothetical protein
VYNIGILKVLFSYIKSIGKYSGHPFIFAPAAESFHSNNKLLPVLIKSSTTTTFCPEGATKTGQLVT